MNINIIFCIIFFLIISTYYINKFLNVKEGIIFTKDYFLDKYEKDGITIDKLNFILEKAIIGLNKLIETYKKCDERSILQTLSLYKNVLDLDNSDLFKDKSEEAVNMDKVFKNIIDIYDDKMMRVVYNILLLMEENKGSQQVLNSYLTALKHFMVPINQKIRAWIQENLVM